MKIMKAGTNNTEFASYSEQLNQAAHDLNLNIGTEILINQQQDKEDQSADLRAMIANQGEILRLQKKSQQKLRNITLHQDEYQAILVQHLSSIQHRLDQFAPDKPQQPSLPFDKHFAIPFYELSFEQEIGKGANSTLYIGSWGHQVVAIKLWQNNADNFSQAQYLREIAIMSRLRGEYIVRFYGACIEPERACLVMEYLENNSLHNMLHSKNGLLKDALTQKRWLIEIAKGLSSLHLQGVIHGNFNSQNILFDAHWHVRIIGFTLASVNTKSIAPVAHELSTDLWQAPEIRQRSGKPTNKSDIYSYGVVAWQIMRMQLMDDQFTLGLIQQSALPAVYKEILQHCLQADYNLRPDLEDILPPLKQYKPISPVPPLSAPELAYYEQQAKKEEQSGHYHEAVSSYQQILTVDSNHAKANFKLGMIYLHDNVEINRLKAFELLLRAAHQGLSRPDLAFNLGRLLEKGGQGVIINLPQALYWYKSAANYYNADNDVDTQKIIDLANVKCQLPSLQGMTPANENAVFSYPFLDSTTPTSSASQTTTLTPENDPHVVTLRPSAVTSVLRFTVSDLASEEHIMNEWLKDLQVGSDKLTQVATLKKVKGGS